MPLISSIQNLYSRLSHFAIQDGELFVPRRPHVPNYDMGSHFYYNLAPIATKTPPRRLSESVKTQIKISPSINWFNAMMDVSITICQYPCYKTWSGKRSRTKSLEYVSVSHLPTAIKGCHHLKYSWFSAHLFDICDIKIDESGNQHGKQFI